MEESQTQPTQDQRLHNCRGLYLGRRKDDARCSKRISRGTQRTKTAVPHGWLRARGRSGGASGCEDREKNTSTPFSTHHSQK